MDDELYNNAAPYAPHHRPMYYSSSLYPPYRSPFVLSRPYLDEDYGDYYRDYMTKANHHQTNYAIREYDRRLRTFETTMLYIRVLAYAQIFISGVLLVADVSRNVLLWNYIQLNGVKIEMLAHLLFPLFALIIGFLCLTTVLNSSRTMSKCVSVILIAIIVPNFLFPKYSIFMSSAIEAVEIGQVMDRRVFIKENEQMMIKSEAHNKMSKMLLFSTSRWPLGVLDISTLPQDFVLMMQYLLIAYSIFSLSLFFFYLITIYLLFRLISVQ